ncbi:eukaryotic translation initiation factor 4 gamma 1-like isoform X2 [Synchiropus splendidus]|uniref:eukaryotic translation initiation factor 4 gamma 1-like isoform X2 n=1 Tax=Synchiropus splendidus TaxID=270530 RepID=UPI00237E0F0D|nr:eukaryotic translation initiation factor 4 gamma 1-like isoform X2 [Synchiropus splendidus]
MNKPPQPITGPTSVPNPAPSPGLTQAAYGPGQPPSLVFATPPPPQMNSAPQPRQFAAGPRTLHQQGYYPSRPTMPTSATRVQTSSGPRAVGPTHVYPSSSQMMMISQQPHPFSGPPQSYFISPYRPPYMAPTQQYPVTSGTAGFYPGTSPAEYQPYEPSLAARERRGGGGRGGGRENGRLALHGAPLTSQRYPGPYYPTQPPFSPSVQPTPAMINPGQQQQQAPPPQQPPAQPQGPPKRERKPITIRDPNQGGRDITDEIMSGGLSSSTPTPPQTSIIDASLPQTNGEVIQSVTIATSRDDSEESSASIETPPPPALANPQPLPEAKEDNCQETMPADIVQSDDPPPSTEVLPVTVKEPELAVSIAPTEVASTAPPDVAVDPVGVELGDTVDAPVAPSATEVKSEELQNDTVTAEKATEEKVENTEKREAVKPEPIAVEEPEAEAATTVSPASATQDTTPTETESERAVEEPAPLTQNASSEPEPEPTVPAETPLSNGIPQDPESEDLALSHTTPVDKPVSSQSQESTPVTKTAPLVQEEKVEKKQNHTEGNKKGEHVPPATATSSTQESTMQAATSVPKKRRNMKEINKKEAIGDLLDAFTEEPEAKPVPEPLPAQPDPVPVAPAEPPAEVADETWEEKEDKLNAEPEKSKPSADSNDKKYDYKEEQWKPINTEDKKRYDRDFLLGFQFSSASMNKPEGLPVISDVVLDKINKTPLRPVDPTRLINMGPDFTPSFLGNLGSRSGTGPRGPPPGPRRSQQGQRKEPRKIISSMSLSDDVQLKKAENAWKPTVKKPRGRGEDGEEEDPNAAKTQEVFKRLRSILNKLTPQKFQDLMKQVSDLPIDTEERLKGAIDLIFEKAISEPNFSVAYANMCRCLLGLKVPNVDAPGEFVNFRKLLLNRCQKEFEKDQDDDEIFELKMKEMEAAKDDEERERLRVELEDARDKARRRSLGNIKFIGELFKLKMLTEPIMHDCVVKLLKNHDEESLECLCRLLSTIGKDLDFEKAKPRMDQYFNQMDKIIKERKTSSRIRFMLQDVLDLRKSNWVPRRADQGPKTIDQIHKEAEMEEHREQIKVQQAMLSRGGGGGGERGGGGGGGGGGGRMDRNMGGRGPHSQGGQRSQPQDEGWNTVPISKNRPIDTTRLSKITKPGALDLNNQLLAPGGKGMWGSWGKGSSGGSGAKPASGDQDSGRPATSTLNRFSALQQSGSLMSADSDRRVPQRSSSSRERGGDRDRSDRDRYDRFDRGMGRDDRGSRNQITKRSFSRETEERGGRGGDSRASNEPVRRVASMTDDRDRGSRDRGSRDRGSRDRGAWERGPSKDLPVKRESAPTPPPVSKPALSEEELEKKAHAIIEEYLHINDMKEALQCVTELNSTSLLFVFVRSGVDSTLERSAAARERMGLLLCELVKAGTLSPAQFYKGLQETLEVAEDMAIDIPHIWLYLAELIAPMLHEGGIPMAVLFRELSKPLLPLEKAGVLLVQILKLLCKGMTPKKVGAMWSDAGLSWTEFLPKDEDVSKFVAAQNVEFTTGEEESKGPVKKKVLSGEELSKQLDRLLQDKANNQRIRDWVEANLEEQQVASNQFVRALMTSVCQSSIICDNPYKVDAQQIKQRASLLQPYLCDEEKELQALYALQALMVHMEQPANLLRMFFDALYDEDVIKEDAFYKWETSKDPAEQTGKGVALKSVTAFFTWLREAEEESDKE